MNLSELGERRLIAEMHRWLPVSTAVVPSGDDAAVVTVRDGGQLVATTDSLVEGVHFRLDWSEPDDVGSKAVSMGVSDIVAMDGEPRWLLVSLFAPPSTATDVVRGIYSGIGEACERYGVEVVGGDTVSASELTLAVTALGELAGEPVRRSGAEVGDVLAVSGPLGRAAAGVKLLASTGGDDATGDDAVACIGAHRRPVARTDLSAGLGPAGIHAAIDVTDGLAIDSHRLAEASGVGVEIDVGRFPVADEVKRLAAARGWDALEIVLGGGEDLELLVSHPPDARVDGLGLIEIGRVVEHGAWLVHDGLRSEMPAIGFDHFREAT